MLIYGEFLALHAENEVRQMNLIRVNSSMEAETCNKLKEGFAVGKKPSSGKSQRQMKYTIAYDGFAARVLSALTSVKLLATPVLARAPLRAPTTRAS